MVTSILDAIIKGGPLMIPLMVCSILALGVLFDRWWAFRVNRKTDTRALRANVLELMDQEKADDAAVLCSNTPGPISAVLLAGLQAYARHREVKKSTEALLNVVEKTMDDYSEHAMSAVQKRLNVLATIGNAAPLLGMTGTVTGMIGSFSHLQEGAGSAAVALGIAEALITTAAGLLIALAAVIPYHYFMSQAGRIDLEINEASSELLDLLATRAGITR